MSDTRIEWAEKTWNPVVGCTPVSAGCRHCYARRTHERFAAMRNAPPFETVSVYPRRFLEPERWATGCFVFVCSMGDLFHEDVGLGQIVQIFDVMARTPRHTYMLLTKRPARMAEFAIYLGGHGRRWPANVWAGVTVENQAAARRLRPLELVPAPVRFVSAEPLLGPVNLAYGLLVRRFVDWVIVGAETGPGHRRMSEGWVRELRDQADAAGAAFFYKARMLNGKREPTPMLDGRQHIARPEVRTP